MEEDRCHKCSNIIGFIPDGKTRDRKRLKLCELCYKYYEYTLENKIRLRNKKN